LIGFVLGALDLLLAESVRLFQAGLDLGLNLKNDFQRQGSNTLYQERSDGFVDRRARDLLAPGLVVFDVSLLAHVIRGHPALVLVVAHRHRAAALAAHDQSLKQRRPFARWARRAEA